MVSPSILSFDIVLLSEISTMGINGHKQVLMEAIMLVAFFSASVFGYRDMQAAQESAIVQVDDFDVGNSITFRFVAPTSGKALIRLIDGIGNFVFHIGIRYDNNQLILNTLINGGWGSSVSVQGFEFTPGAPTSVTVRALSDEYEVLRGDKVLDQLPYRAPVDTVKIAALVTGNGTPHSIEVVFNADP